MVKYAKSPRDRRRPLNSFYLRTLMSANKPRVLMMVQLPPPVHGNAMMNQRAVSSPRVNEEFSIDVLPVQAARSIRDINRLSLRKAFRVFGNILRLLWGLLFRRPDLVYYTIPSSGSAFLGGVCLMTLVKLFRLPHVLQLRARGIAETALQSRTRRILCKWVFSRATVIVFTPRVVGDISQFVRMEQVRYLPNGIEDPYPKSEFVRLPTTEPPMIFFFLT